MVTLTNKASVFEPFPFFDVMDTALFVGATPNFKQTAPSVPEFTTPSQDATTE
jgi:hypothetical protein